MNPDLDATVIVHTWITGGKITPTRILDLITQIAAAIHKASSAENKACALLAESCQCKQLSEMIRKRRSR
jgi:hypothetical protein